MKRIYGVLLAVVIMAVPAVSQAQIYAKLNALYAVVGVVNPQLEFVVGPHSSISIDPMFSPYKSIKWGDRNDIHAQFGILQAEYRFYIKREARGFYVSANAGMQAFDMTRPYLFHGGKFISFEEGFGRGFGLMAGIGIGYTHTFKERWVVDAFFAFDRMWNWYNDYLANGEINLFPRHQKEPKYPDPFNGSAEWLPSKIGVSIGYKIFDPSLPRKTAKQRRIAKMLSE
ncbi:MAG: DUF3575 domain-containing protein [Alistipes sp.]|nr:DUF3575 domain-containing protein [Alistipes sp.]